MIRVITSSTHRSYREAVAQAGKVPGLEADLTGARQQLTTYQAQHDQDQEQLTLQDRARSEDARTIESLQGQIALLRAAALQTAGALAGDREPKSAAYRTAGAFVANANLFGAIASMQLDVAAPWMTLGTTPSNVFVVLEAGGLPHSAHSTEETAHGLAADAGIPISGQSLVRVRVGEVLSPAAV